METKEQKYWSLFKLQSFVDIFNTGGYLNDLLDVLSEDEIDFLVKKNVVFIRSCAPSSHVSISNLTVNGQLTLINFDNDYYRKFSDQEFVAVLLHEIGHVFNPDKQGMDGEYAADEYARSKEYAKSIISGLEKGVKNKWVGFENGSCDLRIKKLHELNSDQGK